MSDIERNNYCGNCYFFQPNSEDDNVGTCRKRSPQMIMHAMENEQHVFMPDWPPVSAHHTHWCGDWRQNGEKPSTTKEALINMAHVLEGIQIEIRQK